MAHRSTIRTSLTRICMGAGLVLVLGSFSAVYGAFSAGLRTEAAQAAAAHDDLHAAVLYSMLAAKDSNWPDHVQLAIAFRNLGDAVFARRVLEEALVQAPKEERDAIRLELFRTLAIQGADNDLLALYQDLPADRKSNPVTGSEFAYGAGMAALRRDRLAQSKDLLERVPASTDYFVYARYGLGEVALRSKDPAKAQAIWQSMSSVTKGADAKVRDTSDVARMKLAEYLLSQSRFVEADTVLAEIQKNSRFYQPALLGRSWATIHRPSANAGGNPYLEALVYLNRSLETDPSSFFGVQSSLLAALCYEKLGATEQASKTLSQAVSRAENQEKIYAQLAQLPAQSQALTGALSVYLARQSADDKRTALQKTLLGQDASFVHLPRLARSVGLVKMGQQNRRALAGILPKLEREGFDPYLLKVAGVDDDELLPDEFLQQHFKNSPVLKSHALIQSRMKRLRLARRYTDLLMEEHQWQSVADFLAKSTMTGKLKEAGEMRARDSQIRDFYLSSEEYAETPAVTALKARIAQLDSGLFLEDRFINQTALWSKTLQAQDKRLRAIEQLPPDRIDPKIVPTMKKLRADLTVRQRELVEVERMLTYYRASKRWRMVNDTLYDAIENPNAQAITEEIARVQQFLKKVRLEDEQAREMFLATLSQMQQKATTAYSHLMREVLRVVFADLLARQDEQLAQLEKAQAGLFEEYRRSVSEEATRNRKILSQYQASLQLELAKVLDAKAFKNTTR